MFKQLINRVSETLSTQSPEGDESAREDALRMATAVLMLDVARADHVFEESEFDRVLGLIQSHFDLAPEDAAELSVSINVKVRTAPEGQDGLGAFLEKRDATFSGR